MRASLKKSSLLKAFMQVKPEAPKASSDIHIVSNYSVKASIWSNSVILV